jgi:hypothetical protein
LRGVVGLEPGEDAVLAASLPSIDQMIAGFETAMQPVATTLDAATLVERPRGLVVDGWPIEATVEDRVGSYVAQTIWLDCIGLRGPVALRPDWLTEMVIGDAVDRVDVLANIRRCEPVCGGYDIIGGPFRARR